jgi:hypothetical protein
MFFSDVSSFALSCRFMIRERSAGPRMSTRLERKPLLVRGSVSLFFMQSLPLYNDLLRRYMLGRSACQHIWIIVMCSIRAELCFIHICPLSLHPYRLSHVSHVSFCIRPECVTVCICMYWNYACIEGLYVYARIPSFACSCV